MSDSQTAWSVLWERAKRVKGPFEIDAVLPDVMRALGTEEAAAKKTVKFLLGELERLPDGKQFFETEGNAVVPLPEFFDAVERGEAPLDAYPYEL